MVIAVDVGNSTVSIGYFRRKGFIVQKIETKLFKKGNNNASIVNRFMAKNDIEKSGFNVIISSVISSQISTVASVFKKIAKDTKVCIVSSKMQTGLTIAVRQPERLGTDRLANAVGAYARHGFPVAVVDFGTATTITVVDHEAKLIGGAILPGVGLMNEALDTGTARLKKVSLTVPGSALGRDTDESILAGILYGTAGAVERILDEVEKDMGISLKTVITGGHCHTMGPLLKRSHEKNMNLTLEGLKILYEKNSAS